MKNRNNFDGPIWLFFVIWGVSALLGIAWIGVCIWAVIYVVTHLGEWIV